jgi:CubicO group peptidase (beta-lactamase class C family)
MLRILLEFKKQYLSEQKITLMNAVKVLPQNIKKFFTGLLILSLLINIHYVYGRTPYEIQQNLDKVMQSMCNHEQFSGAILIAADDKIIFKKSCGLANRSLNVANNINTKFNLGSVGKLFTSVAIAQLIQEKKLSLSTPIYKIIPSWLPNNENAKKITVGQLLIHASGLGSFMDDQRWKLGSDSGLYVTVNDYKPLIHDDKILFTPGMSQNYSNNAYLLLGAIIEAITQTSYSDYLEKNIFKSAGMINTGIWALDEIVPNRAEGYFEDCIQGKCRWKNNNFEAPFIGSPAGGAYSTIEDLFQFSRHLHQSKLLTKEFTSHLLSTDIALVTNDLKIKPYKIGDIEVAESFSPYGFAGAWNTYGFAVWENPLLLGHTGGIQGASAFFATSPDGAYTIIILSNISGSGPIKLYKNIRKILGFSSKITNY